MFLDHELTEIAEAKARLSARCDLRRQLCRLEVHSAWAGMKRKFSIASLGLTVGLGAFELAQGYLRRRKGRGA